MILIDEPRWPGRGRSAGRLWSHLVSDVSTAELDAFAELLGSPRRAFHRDHYDVPEDRFATAVWLGATVVSTREIVTRLTRAGLRHPKHLAR
jgi:nanoRNase/pAp phosphatase (c-di-AMP/oligoRNAs hydrolase)